ncbi:MAG: 2-dehydropantoate 2-reductase [Actinomycetota bacterium]|nr:2-dehydropantoate 2-reductase [Actinomycetota bacterium]
MRIAVVGAGAIGAWLGAALARAGHEVALIARGRRLEGLRRDGVRIRPAGEAPYVAHPLVTDAAAEVGPVDAVLLAVKAHDQARAGAAAAALLGPETAVVSVQNGIPWWYFHRLGGPHGGRRVEAVDPGGAVSAAFPPERAIGCVVYLGAELAADGEVRTRPENGLVVGEPDGTDSARLRAVAAALEESGFPVRRSAGIRTDIWTKLMGNASFNPISALTGAGLGSIARDPGTAGLVRQIMHEVVAIARATGANPSISIEERLAITAALGEHPTSTLQDLRAGKPLELSALTAAPVELARLTGTPAPALEAVHALASLLAARARPVSGV